ncbi:MAG: cytochrome b/b6 domain-containing protein [Thiogranum sp.]|jgi:cytochrome b|nr:cytochrome b/b6 domain-containing protein [Thiogranum sp.]
MESKTIRVWDLPVRVFHWSLVILFTLAYFTGDEENQLHIYSGYAVLGLVLLRILWGFIGTRYARFTDFIYKPGSVIEYLKRLKSSSPQRYIGHTPPGGWMILALLASLLLTSVTGLQVYGLEGKGPLAADATTIGVISPAYANEDEDERERGHSEAAGEQENESDEEFWEELHEFFANLTVLLILLHVAGVVISSRLHGENLVKAMISGRKAADGQ